MQPKNRFSQTVDDYIKYRPSYPSAVLELLINNCGLTKHSIIADIGSGTGLLTKLFLDFGNTVYGVEPNNEMRLAGETFLADYSKFHSIDGFAENTTLKDQSINFITAGTAFHWFDINKTKHEFKRILKQPGWVVLIWNVRDIQHSPLLLDYENLIIQFGKDYKNSKAQEFDKTAIQDFFNPNKMHTKSFPYSQHFDWDGFKGRLLSTSYSLRPGEIHYNEMMLELRKIFDRYEQSGKIEFKYETKLYYGLI